MWLRGFRVVDVAKVFGVVEVVWVVEVNRVVEVIVWGVGVV